MKAKVQGLEEGVINETIVITIESIDELRDLYHRSNMSTSTLQKDAHVKLEYCGTEFFGAMTDLMTKYGLDR